MFEVLFVLLLLGALVLLLGPRFFKRGPRNAEDTGHGQLLITGLSPRPDGVTGEQYVTVSGVIKGDTVGEHPVYQRMAVDVDAWPSIGEVHDVTYSIKNPDNWRFAAPPVDYPEDPQLPNS